MVVFIWTLSQKGDIVNNREKDGKFSDSDMTDAIARFVKTTKEQLKVEEPGGDIVPDGVTQPVLFKEKEVRRILYDNEWYFSVTDIIGALVESTNPARYWSDLKRQLSEKEGFSEVYDKIVKLKMPGADGIYYPTDAASTETILRIVQSIPSKAVEPFKKWLAKVGYERIQEAQNPAIAIKRAIFTYKIKGYTDRWINARIQTIASRKDLTNEWQKRGVKEGLEYALLTDSISMATFDVSTRSHKSFKGLGKRDSLRDHMTPLELALTMLGETATSEIARTTDAQGFDENNSAARSGGEVAGSARQDIERRTGKQVVSNHNFLPKKKTRELT